MIDSQASVRRRLLACLAFAWLFAPAAADGVRETGATSPAGVPQDTLAAPEPAPSTFAPLPADVTVNTLGSVDGPAVGILDDANGGLGSGMWSGAPRAQLEEELTRIPAVTTDPFVRDLSRRLLLTRADAPVGPAHRALITIRLEKLLEAGLIDDAANLAAQAQLPNDAEFARVQAEALLYGRRLPDICSDKTATRLSSAEPFWLQLRAYCYVAAGDTAAADLTRSILDAQGGNDAGFTILLDDVESHQTASPGPIVRPTAIDIFLLQQARLPVTPQIASQLGTAANVLSVRAIGNSPIERLSAAEHIVETGAAGVEELAVLADAQPYSAQQLAEARTQAASLPFLTRQTMLRQAAAEEARPVFKFQLIRRADPALNEAGPFYVFAGLEAKNMLAIPPNAGTGQMSWEAARILILAGRTDTAGAWLHRPDNPLIAEACLAEDIAAPSPSNDTLAQAAVGWLGAHTTTQDGGWPAASALALGVWNALGRSSPETIPPQQDSGSAQLFDGVRPDPVVLQRIDRTAEDPSRRGEAALELLDEIGPRGPERFAPDAVVHFVAVLEKLRLSASAQALAVEGLLLGPPRPSAPPAPVTNPQEPAAARQRP
jgi:hypothetical protein